MIKLGKRLQQLDKLVTTNYDHIWDCCCDHGFLGSTLLNRQAANVIHFVDIVPELMSELHYKLNQFYSGQSLSNSIVEPDVSLWKTHCIDVKNLPLTQYQGKHLVIIAGVGGDLMCEFLSAICQQHPQLDIDFLLCPVHHQYALRQQLIHLNLQLQQEVLIKENNRFYEALLVSTNMSATTTSQKKLTAVTPTGKQLWQVKTEQELTTAKQYLAKTLQHYQRIQQGGRIDVSNIIAAYCSVKLAL